MLVLMLVVLAWSGTVRAFGEFYGTELLQAEIPGGGDWFHNGLPKLQKAMETAQTCPRGTYRGTGLMHYDCSPCPRGTYGGRSGLTSTDECIKCPAGTYSGREGRETIEDCIPCPPGTYGHHAGLTTSACSGRCPEGTYSKAGGLTDWHQCEACPAGYHGDPWMLCEYTIIPRKGTFTPVTPKAPRHRIH